MKKIRIPKTVQKVLITVVILFLVYFIGTGLRKTTSVYIYKYSVSEDGSKLKFYVAPWTSIGCTRGFRDKGGGVKPHYLVFYSTFGGFNSSFGAKTEFELELDENDTEIYMYSVGGYKLVLQKEEETGEWVRPEKGRPLEN